VHIAFGRNDQFHGPLVSCVHHDLVCTECSLTVFGRRGSYEVVTDGQFCIRENRAIPELDRLVEPTRLGPKVKRGESKYESLASREDSTDVISIKYATTRGDILFVIGTGETAEIARDILNSVSRGPMTLNNLLAMEAAQRRLALYRRIVAGLIEYGLLKETK